MSRLKYIMLMGYRQCLQDGQKVIKISIDIVRKSDYNETMG